MNHLDKIDPLPGLAWETDWCSPTYPHPLTRRHHEEWNASLDKVKGEDWREILGKPYLSRNGKGQFRYSPPTPPEKTATGQRLLETACLKNLAAKRVPKVGDRIRLKDGGWKRFYLVTTLRNQYLYLEVPGGAPAPYHIDRGGLSAWEWEIEQ